MSECITGLPEQGSLGPCVWMDGLSFTPHTLLQPRPIRATAAFPLPGCASHSCVCTNMLSMKRLNIEVPNASDPARESESETERKRDGEREGAREKGLEAMEVVHVYCEIHVCPPLQFNTKMKVCL